MRGKTITGSAKAHPATSFNEAPAECGGKPEQPHERAGVRDVASMRPPQNAGENVRLMSGTFMYNTVLQ